jgi:hypothetical protein
MNYNLIKDINHIDRKKWEDFVFTILMEQFSVT